MEMIKKSLRKLIAKNISKINRWNDTKENETNLILLLATVDDMFLFILFFINNINRNYSISSVTFNKKVSVICLTAVTKFDFVIVLLSNCLDKSFSLT